MIALPGKELLRSQRKCGRYSYLLRFFIAVCAALSLHLAIASSKAVAESSPRTFAKSTSAHITVSNSVGAQKLVAIAKELEGIPYRYGGSSQDTGLDCSGLLGLTFAKALGIKLPRRAVDMSKLGIPAPEGDLQGGDLVFFNTLGRDFSHVGLYLGEGRFIHAASRGAHRKVRIDKLSDGYYQQRFNGARRILVALSRVPSRTGTWLWRLPATANS
jgi:cell wall-associated NlpC family hydrolase